MARGQSRLDAALWGFRLREASRRFLATRRMGSATILGLGARVGPSMRSINVRGVDSRTIAT